MSRGENPKSRLPRQTRRKPKRTISARVRRVSGLSGPNSLEEQHRAGPWEQACVVLLPLLITPGLQLCVNLLQSLGSKGVNDVHKGFD